MEPNGQSSATINETPANPLSVEELEGFLRSNGAIGDIVVLTFIAPGALRETFHLPHTVGLVTNHKIAESIRLLIDDRYRDRAKRRVAETVIATIDPFRN